MSRGPGLTSAQQPPSCSPLHNLLVGVLGRVGIETMSEKPPEGHLHAIMDRAFEASWKQWPSRALLLR